MIQIDRMDILTDR